MAVSKEAAAALVRDFIAEYPGMASLRFVLLADERSFYEYFGEEEGARVLREWGASPAAFRQSTRTVGIALANVDEPELLKAVLRHECLGHSGINSFEPEHKRALLEALIAARDQPHLSAWWAAIDSPGTGYAQLSDYEKAEELFCWACEEIGKKPLIPQAFEHAWRHQVIGKTEPLQLWGLCQIAEYVAHGYRLDARPQRTFPASDDLQFRRGADQDREPQAQVAISVATIGKGLLLKSAHSGALAHGNGRSPAPVAPRVTTPSPRH